MGKTRWSPARVARLLELLRESLSASDIARLLAGEFRVAVTRNAVIGKVHRLALQLPGGNGNGHKTQYRGGRRRRAIKVIPTKMPGQMPPPPATLNVPVVQRLPESRQCRWPVGDPRHPEAFGYCHGIRIDDRHSYCASHTRLAYRVH